MQPETHTISGAAQCIEIFGADARAFAQAQFSGDLRSLESGYWQWNAWLDPKGSVRALMHLADLGDGRLLALLRGGHAQLLCGDLRRYVLRSKVSFEASGPWQCLAGPALTHGTISLRDDTIGFGYGDRSLWLQRHGVREPNVGAEALRLLDIRNGWPSLPPGGHTFFPPALGLEHLGAVSFDKGCYPGQEIAARLHYRGGHKLRLAHVRSRSPLAPGQPLSSEQPRAIVLDALGANNTCEALAVLEEGTGPLQGIEVVQRFEA